MKNLTNNKKISLLVVSFLCTFAPVLGASVSLDPSYYEARFTPAETLHAGCVDSVKLNFKADGKQIENVHLVMSYVPKDIEIARVASDANDPTMINYNVEYDRLVLNFLNPEWKKLSNTSLFQIYFKSVESLTSTVISLQSWSYALTTNGEKIPLTAQTPLSFKNVAECDPDIVPPIISLNTPTNNKDTLPLDAHFIFALQDMWKWVDKDSVQIEFAWEQYTADSPYLEWNGDYLTFYPKNWLPIDEKLSLHISVWDKQAYGWSNFSKKEFVFQTADAMKLENDISPETYRKVIHNSATIFGSVSECDLLKKVYPELDMAGQSLLKTTLHKLACSDVDTLSFVPQRNTDQVHAATLVSTTDTKKVSVFTVLWWTLFAIALLLKFHYYFAYRRQKKLVLASEETKY